MYRCLFELSPFVHGLSCDEAIVDVTMACHRGGTIGGVREHAEVVAKKLRATIAMRTGCNASVGIGSNRLLARVALARAKPDSFYHLTGSSVELREMLDSLPVSQLPQVYVLF
jgi:nucleotidyltransferase/DNA polymerase involved in DNA repair